VLASFATAACTTDSSATDLHPEGPPMIEQVRLVEIAPVAGDPRAAQTVFAFGTHPLATADDAHPVGNAAAEGNRLRIIFDELLRGNNLEEIQCRAVVDEDAFARVPIGATPDDIARCAIEQDALASRCPGSNPLSVCICRNAAGCAVTRPDRTVELVAQGDPVGVSDVDRDGAADLTRFIAGAVGITCGTIDVPIDTGSSYWTPSGSQQKPTQGGFDSLGPAIVLVPQNPLPTGATCALRFASDVVDKDGIGVCAPPDGDITAGCTPGDTAAFKFTVESLVAFASSAVSTGQSRTDGVTILFNAPVDIASVAGITVTEAPATSYTQFMVVAGQAADQIVIRWTAIGGLAAGTQYTVTVPTTVTDTYGQPLEQSTRFTFTTGS
jgi:hypothetical protein